MAASTAALRRLAGLLFQRGRCRRAPRRRVLRIRFYVWDFAERSSKGRDQSSYARETRTAWCNQQIALSAETGVGFSHGGHRPARLSGGRLRRRRPGQGSVSYVLAVLRTAAAAGDARPANPVPRRPRRAWRSPTSEIATTSASPASGNTKAFWVTHRGSPWCGGDAGWCGAGTLDGGRTGSPSGSVRHRHHAGRGEMSSALCHGVDAIYRHRSRR